MSLKILLVCSNGMSTSLLQQNIIRYAKSVNIETEVKAYPAVEAKGIFQDWDVILLGPQVGYELANFKELTTTIPVAIIPANIYAMGKGKETLQFAQELLTKK